MKRIALLIDNNYQDEEGVEPKIFLESNGFQVEYIGIEKGIKKGKFGRNFVTAGKTFSETNPNAYEAIIIPGGAAPEYLRVNDLVIDWVKKFLDTGKLVAAICHWPQVLISADACKGRHMTCYVGIRDDIKLAGAIYEDKEVLIDGNFITSRKPEDIPAFNKAILQYLSG